MTDELTEAKLADGQKINVRHCGSCDGSHEGVEIHSLKGDAAPFTHWYRCSRTGDPVQTCLRMRGNVLHELQHKIADSLMKATESGKFMVAVWHDDGGQLNCDKFSESFPFQQIEGDDGWLDKIYQRVKQIREHDRTKKPDQPSIGRLAAIELLIECLGNEIAPPDEPAPRLARLRDNAPNLLGVVSE